MKKLVSAFLSTLLLVGLLGTGSIAAASSDNAITVFLDGQQVVFDQPPVVQNGRTLVPLRAIFERLGAEVEWHPEKQMIVAQKDITTIVMVLGQTQFTKETNGDGGVPYELDVAPVARNGRTLVPLRAVSESFGCEVSWDGDHSRVDISTNSQTNLSNNSDNRLYFNPRYSTSKTYRSAAYNGDTLYFAFANEPSLYMYDGSSVHSFSAGGVPTDIVPCGGEVYYYTTSNQTVYCLDTATGTRETLFNQNGQMEIGQLLLYRNYLIIYCKSEDAVYAVNRDTGSSTLLYKSDALSNEILVTCAGGKVFLLDYFLDGTTWSHSIFVADLATGSHQNLYTDVGSELFCAADGSGIYFYSEAGGSKVHSYHVAATGTCQTIHESAYNAAKTAYFRANQDSWLDDWYYGSTSSDRSGSGAGIYRYSRSSDLSELLYRGSGCVYLANNQSQVAFIQSESGFTAGSQSWGYTAVYVMDLDGGSLTEIVNNGETSTTPNTGDNDENPSLEPITCRVCHGSGWVVCPYCHGMGVSFGEFCPLCGGSGRQTCAGCHGAGILYPQQ